MSHPSSPESESQWNSYLLRSSLDAQFSDQLSTFLRKLEEGWTQNFTDVNYELCQLEAGNRLRPIVSFLGYLISENDHELSENEFYKIVKIGICIELIHKSSLIIDDIVDNDSLRNGKTTFHIANGHDKAIAVTSHLISKSLKILFDVLKEVNTSGDASLRCLEISINILNDMSTGLLKELAMDKASLSDIKLTEEIIRKETASIIKNSLLIGYILRGGENQIIISCLNKIGESCGYIFQVMNDIEPYRKGLHYKTHKGKEELEFFVDRKNIITSFILQLLNPSEKAKLHHITNVAEGQEILLSFFNSNNVYDHFILEIEEIKKSIAHFVNEIRSEGINNRWCENCLSFINSLTDIAISRCL